MLVSYNWLQTYFKEKLPPAEKVGEVLTFSAFEIDGIEQKNGDSVLDVKVLPDRAHYALCHRGIAHEIAAAIDEKIVLPLKKNPNVEKLPPLKVVISDPNPISHKLEAESCISDCRRYIGRRVSGVKISESPKRLKERLESIGERSINNVVDAANFVMFDMGQPLHAFDADKVKGAIQIRRAESGEKISTLDCKDIILDSEILMIADDMGPLAIAGIKGGKRAEVGPETKNLILESANFEPTLIRRASERLQIRTGASKRFENEISPEVAGKAMTEFSALLADLLPEAEFGEVKDAYPTPARQSVIEAKINFINSLLDLKISEKEIAGILERLGIAVEIRGGGVLSAAIPFERLDLKIPEDLAEEVGRLYGYDKVPVAALPAAKLETATPARFYLENRIREILVAGGFSEIMASSLSAKGELAIEKPLASDKSFLRTNLSENLKTSLKLNAANAPLIGLPEVKIFEIGKVWPASASASAGEFGGREESHLALGYAPGRIKNKGIVEGAVKKISAELGIELKAKITDNAAEIDLEPIPPKISAPENWRPKLPPVETTKYKPFSTYPFIVRDVALFVPENISDQAVWSVIEKAVGQSADLLANHYLFDIYKPKGPPAGAAPVRLPVRDTQTGAPRAGGQAGEQKISYAFRLVFQSAGRTLTDGEVNKIMAEVYKGLADRGWQAR